MLDNSRFSPPPPQKCKSNFYFFPLMQKNLGLGARKRLEGKRASGMYYANIRRLRRKRRHSSHKYTSYKCIYTIKQTRKAVLKKKKKSFDAKKNSCKKVSVLALRSFGGALLLRGATKRTKTFSRTNIR